METTICLIANVGQRDLQENGAPLDSKRLRAEGERIDAEYDACKARLSMPMLSAALRQVELEQGRKVSKVLLVATDQANERFRAGDTVSCARVLARMLREELGNTPQVVMIDQEPFRYDAMLSFFQRKVVTRKTARADVVYVLCAGGTPACITALLLAAIGHFREKCRALVVGQGNTVATPLAVGAQVLDSYRREGLERLLERYDFSAVAANRGHPETAQHIAAAAAARLNFDFAAHHRILTELARTGEAVVPDGWLEEAGLLALGDRSAALRDLYWNAVVKWERNECCDFLGRVWRLMESGLQTALGEVSDLTFDGTVKSDNAFKKWAESVPGLIGFLQKADLAPRASTPVMEKTLQFLVEQEENGLAPDRRVRFRLFLETMPVFGRARKLRNRSIIAHGFQGLNRQDILDALEKDEEGMLETLRTLLDCFGVTAGENIYQPYVQAIRQAAGTGR